MVTQSTALRLIGIANLLVCQWLFFRVCTIANTTGKDWCLGCLFPVLPLSGWSGLPYIPRKPTIRHRAKLRPIADNSLLRRVHKCECCRKLPDCSCTAVGDNSDRHLLLHSVSRDIYCTSCRHSNERASNDK